MIFFSTIGKDAWGGLLTSSLKLTHVHTQALIMPSTSHLNNNHHVTISGRKLGKILKHSFHSQTEILTKCVNSLSQQMNKTQLTAFVSAFLTTLSAIFVSTVMLSAPHTRTQPWKGSVSHRHVHSASPPPFLTFPPGAAVLWCHNYYPKIVV